VSSGQIPVLSSGKRTEIARIIARSSVRDYCFHFPSVLEAFVLETVIFPDLSGRFHSLVEVGIIVVGKLDDLGIPKANDCFLQMIFLISISFFLCEFDYS
jgi:hypothetical protein